MTIVLVGVFAWLLIVAVLLTAQHAVAQRRAAREWRELAIRRQAEAVQWEHVARVALHEGGRAVPPAGLSPEAAIRALLEQRTRAAPPPPKSAAAAPPKPGGVRVISLGSPEDLRKVLDCIAEVIPLRRPTRH